MKYKKLLKRITRNLMFIHIYEREREKGYGTDRMIVTMGRDFFPFPFVKRSARERTIPA